jgi:lipoprotein-anchoring transpeptidase ErfK/SrfK
MWDQGMKRAASISGIAMAALLSAAPTTAMARSDGADISWGARPTMAPTPPARVPGTEAIRKRSKASARKSESKNHGKTEPALVIPPGPLHVIVAIDKQRVTLFADGKPVASSTIFSGTPGHPTPLGVFSVIQKRRHHISNLYAAQMPYMQRLTWSGTAMHQGPLPGRPASHGCIRLTKDFAQLLWKATKVGARVIVTQHEVAPVLISHPRLFEPAPKLVQAERAVEPPAPRAPIKTADALNAVAIPVEATASKHAVAEAAAHARGAEQATKVFIGTDGKIETFVPAAPAAKPIDNVKPDDTADSQHAIVEQPSIMVEPAPRVAEVKRNSGPVSVFVSRKAAKLYVRQNMKPLFEAPVTIANPDEPIGTHIYTAMDRQDAGPALRWTVVSIPSHNRRAAGPLKSGNGRKRHNSKAIKAIAAEPVPMPSASDALDRVIMPPDAVERISELITPGSSLIVSDNKLSDETGESTGFIVLTP